MSSMAGGHSGGSRSAACLDAGERVKVDAGCFQAYVVHVGDSAGGHQQRVDGERLSLAV